MAKFFFFYLDYLYVDHEFSGCLWLKGCAHEEKGDVSAFQRFTSFFFLPLSEKKVLYLYINIKIFFDV